MKQVTFKNLKELPFYVTEALNQLRINIELSGADVKVIMFTSCFPNEGKSFVSFNVWRQLSELGYKTLYIDSDLRNSEMRTVNGLSSDEKLKGIVHYLSGKITMEEAIYSTNVENGYVMPVAKNIPNPTNILESDRYREMIEKCREQFDYVIIDTPPLVSVADAVKIATYCDGTMLVVRSQSTPRKIVASEINKLQRTGTPFLGPILNRVSTGKSSGYGYGYGRYGRYGYGYGRYGYGEAYGAEKKKKRLFRRKED